MFCEIVKISNELLEFLQKPTWLILSQQKKRANRVSMLTPFNSNSVDQY